LCALRIKCWQHFFRHFEIRNHAVFHRANGDDVARRAPEHLFGVAPDGFDLICHFVDSDNRRFRDDDAAPFRINERVRRAEVNRQITGKQTE
jgi:hypothetical protein